MSFRSLLSCLFIYVVNIYIYAVPIIAVDQARDENFIHFNLFKRIKTEIFSQKII